MRNIKIIMTIGVLPMFYECWKTYLHWLTGLVTFWSPSWPCTWFHVSHRTQGRPLGIHRHLLLSARPSNRPAGENGPEKYICRFCLSKECYKLPWYCRCSSFMKYTSGLYIEWVYRIDRHSRCTGNRIKRTVYYRLKIM